MVYKELLVIAIVSVAFVSIYILYYCIKSMCTYLITMIYILGLLFLYILKFFMIVNRMHYKPDILILTIIIMVLS